jgi:hypothetical protein
MKQWRGDNSSLSFSLLIGMLLLCFGVAIGVTVVGVFSLSTKGGAAFVASLTTKNSLLFIAAAAGTEVALVLALTLPATLTSVTTPAVSLSLCPQVLS